MSTPARYAVVGIMIGWLITLIAMFMARRPSSARIRQRNLAGLLGVSLQAMGFGLVFGWRRPELGSSGADWIIAASSASIAIASALFFLMAVRVKDGHLFLALIMDVGIYEFEPATKPQRSPQDHRSHEPSGPGNAA